MTNHPGIPDFSAPAPVSRRLPVRVSEALVPVEKEPAPASDEIVQDLVRHLRAAMTMLSIELCCDVHDVDEDAVPQGSIVVHSFDFVAAAAAIAKAEGRQP